MNEQLKECPFPVFRHKAADSTNYEDLCSGVENLHNAKVTLPSRANWCSQHQIWKSVSESTQKPDYVIVVEDDVYIPSNFFQRAQRFLNSSCGNQEWDILAVDTFETSKRNWNTEQYATPTLCDTDKAETILTYDNLFHTGAGSHMMIYRSNSLEKILRMPLQAMDKYQTYPRNINLKFWNPKIIWQASVGPFKTQATEALWKITECNATDFKSTIGKNKKFNKFIGNDLQC